MAFELPQQASITPLASHHFDALSALLSGLTFGLLIIGIDGYAHGGGAVGALVELCVAVVCGALLVRRQLDRSAPLLPVDLPACRASWNYASSSSHR